MNCDVCNSVSIDIKVLVGRRRRHVGLAVCRQDVYLCVFDKRRRCPVEKSDILVLLMQIFISHTMVTDEKKKNRKTNLTNDKKTACMTHALIDVQIYFIFCP